MSIPKLVCLLLLVIPMCHLCAQPDGSLLALQQLPAKYFKETGKKIDKYTHRISNKTEKTLTRLSRWEAKVQSMLQKVNPSAAAQLFANEQLTFKGMLAQYKKGEAAMQQYRSSYDGYRDKLTTQFRYLDSNKNFLSKKSMQAFTAAKLKTESLDEEEKANEALRKMIRERKKQLLTEATKLLGKNKQLQKINKETYYYIETVKNYKQLFKEKTKREEAAKKLLEKVPGFKDFIRKNTMLASVFKLQDNSVAGQSLAGLQTRANVSNLIQSRIASGGPNAMSQFRQNLQSAQAEMNKLKNNIIKSGGSSSSDEIPDFKPNAEKAKTFRQRLQYDINLQFEKTTSYMPGTANMGLGIGYKLNNKSIAGLGLSYKLGLGKIDRIRFTHEGIGLRSFIDWKIEKQFFVSGGYELNHNTSFKDFSELKDVSAWQQSGLLGISKKIPFKTKWTKGTKFQLLYDFLHRQHLPVTQPVIFRIGYDLK